MLLKTGDIMFLFRDGMFKRNKIKRVLLYVDAGLCVEFFKSGYVLSSLNKFVNKKCMIKFARLKEKVERFKIYSYVKGRMGESKLNKSFFGNNIMDNVEFIVTAFKDCYSIDLGGGLYSHDVNPCDLYNSKHLEHLS